ncbi:MAG: CBS domain-containing protein, partial [Nitrososphaeraceae archaeon]
MYLASLNQRLGDIVQRDYTSLDDDTIIADAVKVMKEKGISSVFVKASSSSSKIVQKNNDKQSNHLNPIIGIVTERDILYRVVGQNKGPYKATLRDVMSSPIITIDEDALVKDAISLMRNKHIRRLLVIEKKAVSDIQEIGHEKEDHSFISKTYNSVPIGMVSLMTMVGNFTRESLELAEIESPIPGNAITTALNINCPYCESTFQNKNELSA